VSDERLPSDELVVAAFDFDGTLTTRDCVVPFLERLGGRRGIAAALARSPHRAIGAAARRDRDRMKSVVVGGVFAGRRVDEVDVAGREFAEVVHATMLRPDTLARLQWHQAMGHRTVIVSASLRSYLDPLATMLGFDQALCTDVAVANGRYAASLDRPNCRAAEKVVRLCEWMAANGSKAATLWAYGDSTGDRELLRAAHHPVWVKGTTVTAVPDEDAR
jgi:phosphatidylglycerophosphatase C